MKVLRRPDLSALLAWFFLSATAAAHGGEPLDLVKSAAERVIALLKDPQLKSIVNNYRSQFDRIIAKSSFDELKRMLREKAG